MPARDITERDSADDLHSGDELRFRAVGVRDDDTTDAGACRGRDRRQHTRDGSQAAVEPELADMGGRAQ